MNRRSFIQSIAIVGFGNLFLPKAMDHFRWKAPVSPLGDFMVNPDYVNALYEEAFIDIARCERAGLAVKGLWVHWPLRFNFPVDPSNREEMERHSIAPFIRVQKICKTI